VDFFPCQFTATSLYPLSAVREKKVIPWRKWSNHGILSCMESFSFWLVQ